MESAQGSAALVLEEASDRIVSKLHEVLRPFLLRRLKDDVLSIKAKREIVVYAPLTEAQAYFYQAIREKRLAQVLSEVAAAQHRVRHLQHCSSMCVCILVAEQLISACCCCFVVVVVLCC